MSVLFLELIVIYGCSSDSLYSKAIEFFSFKYLIDITAHKFFKTSYVLLNAILMLVTNAHVMHKLSVLVSKKTKKRLL